MVTPIKNYLKFAKMERVKRISAEGYGGSGKVVKDKGGGGNIVLVIPFRDTQTARGVLDMEFC